MLLTNSLACLRAWRVRFGLLGGADLFIGRLRKGEADRREESGTKGRGLASLYLQFEQGGMG